MTRDILFWVNCYGGWAPEERHPIETIGYDQYLSGVADAIASLSDQIDQLWVSGAMIDAQGRLECQTTSERLALKLRERGVHLEINQDDESITSMSIARVFLRHWKNDLPNHIGILCCDAVRFESNVWVLEQLAAELGFTIPPAKEVLLPIARLDIHPNSTPEKQAEKLATMKEKGIAWVEEQEIKARRGE